MALGSRHGRKSLWLRRPRRGRLCCVLLPQWERPGLAGSRLLRRRFLLLLLLLPLVFLPLLPALLPLLLLLPQWLLHPMQPPLLALLPPLLLPPLLLLLRRPSGRKAGLLREGDDSRHSRRLCLWLRRPQPRRRRVLWGGRGRWRLCSLCWAEFCLLRRGCWQLRVETRKLGRRLTLRSSRPGRSR